MVARWQNPTSNSLTITNADGSTRILKPREIITGDFYGEQGLLYVDDLGVGIDLSDHPGIAEVVGPETRVVGGRVVSQNTLAFNLDFDRNPTGADNTFPVGARWFNTATGITWRLASLSGDVATWTPLGVATHTLRFAYEYTANPGFAWRAEQNHDSIISPVDGTITRAHVVVRAYTHLSDFQILKNDVVEFTYQYDDESLNADGVNIKEFTGLNISVTTQDKIAIRTGPDNGTLHSPTATLFIE